MDELKEKIARAIAAEDIPEMQWVELSHRPYLKLAQAALTAIEETGYRVVPSDVAEEINHNSNVSNGLIAEKASKGITPDVGASCAVLSDSATSFDPEKQFEKDNDASQKWGFRCDAHPDGRCEDPMCLRHDCKIEKELK